MTESAARRGRLLGYFEAVAAACLWGSSGIFAVHLFRRGLPPESVAMWRPLVGVVFLFVGLSIARPGALRVGWRAMAVLAVGGGAAVGLLHAAYQFSTDALGVPTTVALLYLAPAFVAAASGPLLHEWPTKRRVALVAVTLVGVWLSVLGAEDVAPTFGASGLVWGVLAGLGYALSTLFGRYATPRFGPYATVVYSTLGACVVLGCVLLVLGEPLAVPPDAGAWLLVVAFGALTVGAAQLLFFDALGRIEASRVSVATAAEPAVAAMLATVLLSQGLRPVGWLGVGLIMAGVGLSAGADGPTVEKEPVDLPAGH